MYFHDICGAKLENIDNIVKSYNVPYNINYGSNYFPTKKKSVYRRFQMVVWLKPFQQMNHL